MATAGGLLKLAPTQGRHLVYFDENVADDNDDVIEYDDDDDDDDAPPEVGIGNHTQHALQGSALGVALEALCR